MNNKEEKLKKILFDIINKLSKDADVYHHNGRVEGVIKNGIKEVQPLPAQDGNRDWGLYYNRKEDRTKPFTEYVKDVIENGNKIHDI